MEEEIVYSMNIVKDHEMKESFCLQVDRLSLSIVIM